MKKILFLYLALVNLAFGYNYDEILLKAQSSIFPKIILLDKKLPNKLIDHKIVFTIVYDQSDYYTALEVKQYINNEYKGHFDTYDYKINLVKFSDFSKDTQGSAFYFLNSAKKIDTLAKIAKQKGVISFSYDIDNLKKGLMFSLVIEKSTTLYVEKENLYTQKIDFVDSLLQMVKFVEQDNLDKTILFNGSSRSKTMYAKIIGKTLKDLI